MKKERGKLIVLEGVDGSGKTTQHELLIKYLKSKKVPVKTIKFPRHGEYFFGKFIDRYLNGDFGDPTNIDPYLGSVLFALDRFEVSKKIVKWLNEGYYVIPDRYTTSNHGHQLGKMIDKTDKEKDEYLKWDKEMEYKILGIPAPDLVIYLNLDFEVIKQLLKKRGRGDKHEDNDEYLLNSKKAYEFVYKHSKNWKKVDCTYDKQILSPKEIHKKIIKLINVN